MLKQYRKNFLALAVLALSIFTGSAALANVKMVQVNGELRPAYREGEVLVKYRDGVSRSLRSMESLYQRISVVDIRRFSGEFKNFEHLIFNTNNLTVEEAVADLQRDPSVEYAQPNYMIYAFKNKLEKPKSLGEPCLIPGIPFPPGCDDGGGGEQPPPGEKQPCLIPGIPFPPGCEDTGGGPGDPGNPPPGGERPAIQPLPAEPAPAVDTDLAKAWGIAKTSSDKAWVTQKGSKNVVVAVIDTGIDYNHPDLAFNVWRNPNAGQIMRTGIDPTGDSITGDIVGWDFVHNDNLPYDDNQHGTHCAGVVGAVGNDGKGISGVSQRVSIMGVKFLSGQGSGDTASAIKSIDYAVSRGAKVLSNSWGGKGDDGTNGGLKDAIERAGKAGVLFVAAAGNDSTDNDRDPVFPAAFNLENMVTVAATTETDGMAFFSNKGVKSVHIGAPGANVYSTTPGNGYAKLSGTSMACPHVAGAAALLWAQFPNADYKEIKKRLMDFGDAVPALNGKTITGKRLNVQKSVEAKL
jgi:subtilisin family serine protease